MMLIHNGAGVHSSTSAVEPHLRLYLLVPFSGTTVLLAVIWDIAIAAIGQAGMMVVVLVIISRAWPCEATECH